MKLATIKQLFFNHPFLSLYPICEKTNDEKEELIASFNSCDINEESETATLVNELYAYTLSKVNLYQYESESLERNLNHSYKTKKIKTLNEETGKKEKSKITVEKRGSKRIIERFKSREEFAEKNTERFRELAEAFEQRSLTKEHLPLLDMLLEENRYKKWLYTTAMTIVLLLPIVVFVLAKLCKI